MNNTTEITTEITALFFQGLEEKLQMLRTREADLESRALTEQEYATLRYTRERIAYHEVQHATIADLLCFAELTEREAYYAGK